MNRNQMWRRIEGHSQSWDMVVVGGGATGVGVAIDAAARGYDVLLLEQSDFGKGTSSRSTKLAHGGVRYLEQGNIGLVMEALKGLDPVAYVRFASVYRDFREAADFQEVLGEIAERAAKGPDPAVATPKPRPAEAPDRKH